MTTWNYRVTKTRVADGIGGEQDIYQIREVYYDDGKITSWSQEPITPLGESWQELAEELVLMQRAIAVKVVDLTGDEPREMTMKEMVASGHPARN